MSDKQTASIWSNLLASRARRAPCPFPLPPLPYEAIQPHPHQPRRPTYSAPRTHTRKSDQKKMSYITEEGKAGLKKYTYKGEDRSLLYKHVLSPWADFCVRRLTPLTVA
jgi:hypothetical protein